MPLSPPLSPALTPATGLPPRPAWQIYAPRTPHMSDWQAVPSIALSVIAMTFLGPVFILLFYGLWLPCLYFKRRWILRPYMDLLLPILIVSYGVASFIWSTARVVTLRSALEFASVILCSAIIARLVSTKALLQGMAIGTCTVLAATLIQSHGLPQGDESLTGALGSKNQVGAVAEIGFYCALIYWFSTRNLIARLGFSLLPLLLCALCLVFSHSATSDVSLAAVLAITAAAYVLGRLPKKLRWAAFVIATLLVLSIAVASITFGLEDIGLKSVGKDATLTGRTYLWSKAYEVGQRRPLLGVGASAFWVPGNPDAEALWYKFGIAGRSGFHFHNLFVNLFVEEGLLGAALWLMFYLATGLRSARYLLRHTLSYEAVFYVGIAAMYLVRAFTEVDTTGPFGTGPVLFFVVAMRIAMRHRREPKAATKPLTNRLNPVEPAQQ